MMTSGSAPSLPAARTAACPTQGQCELIIGFHGVAACRALRRERAVRDRVVGGSSPLAPTSPLHDLHGDFNRLIWILPLDQGVQAVPVRREQGPDALRANIRDDDVANLVVDVAEEAVRPHLLGLVTIVVGRADVVD